MNNANEFMNVPVGDLTVNTSDFLFDEDFLESDLLGDLERDSFVIDLDTFPISGVDLLLALSASGACECVFALDTSTDADLLIANGGGFGLNGGGVADMARFSLDI